MEKIKAVKILISRYKADYADLAQREEDLAREIEIIENLISTITILYISKVIQTKENSSHQETDNAREKLDNLKMVLRELRQSIQVVIEEEIVIRRRIKELETMLTYQPDQYNTVIADGNKHKQNFTGGSNRDLTFKKEIINHESEHFELKKVDSEDNQRQGIGEEVGRVRATKSIENTSKRQIRYEKENDKIINTAQVRQEQLNCPSKEKLSLSVNKQEGKEFKGGMLNYKKRKLEESFQGKCIVQKNKNEELETFGQARVIRSNENNPQEFEESVTESFQGKNINWKNTTEELEAVGQARVSINKENTSQFKESVKGHDKITKTVEPKLDEEELAHSTNTFKEEARYLESKIFLDKNVTDDITNYENVHRNLLNQVSELKEELENCSLNLRQSEDYVKQLELECIKLEQELQEKIKLLTQKSNSSNDNENVLQQNIEDQIAPCEEVQEPFVETKSMNEVLSASSNMVEGEGVTPAYMQLAHWRFALKLPEYQGDRDLKEKLLTGIKQGNMAPYYKAVCADLGWEFDSKLYDEMCAANTKRLEELEKEHENNVMDEEDQSQLCGVWQSKLDYLCSIGDSENATALANSKVDDKTVPKSHRIDAVFSLFRISFFHGCNIKGMSTAIEKATELIEGISGGDWSARNKLKAYEGVWSLAIRDFTRAAHLFVDVVPTFESYELADFGTIIRYTVLSCMIALPRCDLRKKLMLHGVMAQALHSQYQDLREYFVSLYDGRYSDFLVCLARIEVEMKRDPLLHPHYRHYVQEMRLRAYKQILQAYRSLSLDYMAQSFGVTSEFIEREVARFAAAGRLQCKIDSVAGTVITSAHLDDSVRSKEAPEASLDRNILYQTTVKRGDILLNRLKKLARVMDF